MVQTKKQSGLEAVFNTMSGFLLSYLAWKFVVSPAIEHGIIGHDDAFVITVFFTFISLGRNYIIRRLNTK